MVKVEGKAIFKLPANVFYNPVQEFNRDLSVAVIRHFLKTYSIKNPLIFEGLSATGLRSLRYAKEIPGTKIISNDIDPQAVENIRQNIALNEDFNLKLGERMEVTNGDVNFILHNLKNQGIRPNVIDLDPYGSAAPFLDSAIQAIDDGGLLCITCTDLAVLCANHPETCLAKYGGVPMKGKTCHESALRLVLNATESVANRYKRCVVPLLSCSIDFYVRLFMRVYTSPKEVKQSSRKRGLIVRCKQCKSFDCWPLLEQNKEKYSSCHVGPQSCSLCKSRLQIFGPMWLKELHEQSFLNGLVESIKSTKDEFKTFDRMLGLLIMASEEIEMPLFLELSEMSSFLRVSIPPLTGIRSAILNASYRLSGSHTEPLALKSDAPASLIWKILVEKSVKLPEYAPGTPQANLVQELQTTTWSLNFEKNSEAIPQSKQLKVKRFPENPEKNWGPKSRPKRSLNL